jgi:DNA-binding LacI/PurR family transcriptional regulator
MRKVSQKDIAESLNISRVTVTKALKDHPDIAVDTIKKVKDKALEMGYIPNLIGRSLSSQRTYMIGVVVPKIDHSFFSYSIEKIYESAQSRGYNIIPMVSFEDNEQEIENIRTLISMSVDGIILDPSQNTADNQGYQMAVNAGCKVIYYDRCPSSNAHASVVTDDRNGAYEITRHLIEKGYRKIYHFAGPGSLNIADERRKGYEAAMNENNLLSHILNVELTRENGYKALKRVADENELPDAIFAVNDPVAFGIYDAANELGIKIPDDLAVVGFGDIRTSALISPPMTTVRPPLDQMAEATVDILVDMIENKKDFNSQKIFKSKLIIRNSA